MRTSIQVLLTCALFTVGFLSCAPDDPGPCADVQCRNNEVSQPPLCDCVCEEDWCGQNCEIPVVECVNGTYDHTICGCDCYLNYCGETCETLIQTCVNGVWDSANCECDCEAGWAGIDCSELDKVDNADSYIQFELIEVTDGIETTVATINQVNLEEGWEPTNFQAWPPLMSNFWEGGGSLFIDFPPADIEIGFYPANEDEGVFATLALGDQALDFWGHAISGQMEIVQSGSPYHGLFSFICADELGEDTVKVVNGVFHSWEPE